MTFRSLLLFVPFAVVACSDADHIAATEGPTGEAQSRATFTLSSANVVATRMPVHAGCLETSTTFTDDDLFTLQPVDQSAPKDVASIALSFKRTVTKGVALDLPLTDRVGGAKFENAAHASSSDEKTGVGVVVFSRQGAPEKALASAHVTMIDVASKDGEPLSAHVLLEFADGDVLDETFTGSLKSYEGACAAH